MLIRVATVTDREDCRVKVLSECGCPCPWLWDVLTVRFTCRFITTAGPNSLTSGVTVTSVTFTRLAGVNAQDIRWNRPQV